VVSSAAPSIQRGGAIFSHIAFLYDHGLLVEGAMPSAGVRAGLPYYSNHGESAALENQ
jgi:hypothetical protein